MDEDEDDEIEVDEEAIFAQIVRSMGVTRYDPAVPQAIADFARSKWNLVNPIMLESNEGIQYQCGLHNNIMAIYY